MASSILAMFELPACLLPQFQAPEQAPRRGARIECNRSQVSSPAMRQGDRSRGACVNSPTCTDPPISPLAWQYCCWRPDPPAYGVGTSGGSRPGSPATLPSLSGTTSVLSKYASLKVNRVALCVAGAPASAIASEALKHGWIWLNGRFPCC